MKKKIIMILLSAAMAVSAAACAGSTKNGETAKTDESGTDSANGSGDEAGILSMDIKYDIKECVSLGDYKALKVSMPNTYEVTQAQVDDYALSMAKYYAQPTYKETDKKVVEEGDTANIDYVGKKDGVAFEGGTAQGYNLTIGSNSFIDGFEEGLIGKKVGETTDLNLKFPDGYGNADLAGKAVVFTVTVNKIMEEDPSYKFELTDEFVNANFNIATVKEFKENIKEYLKNMNDSTKTADTNQAVIDELLNICKVTLPDKLLEARVKEYIEVFTKKNCGEDQKDEEGNRMTLATYLKSNYNGMTEEDFRKQSEKEIEKSLQTELILEAIAAQEGMELREDDFKKYTEEKMQAGGHDTQEALFAANGVTAEAGEAYMRKTCLGSLALEQVVKNADIAYGVTPEGEK